MRLLPADPARPARVWMRQRRASLLALGFGAVGVMAFDAWLGSCGFDGCPSAAQIRAYRPSEGSAVLDRNGRLLGHLSVVRRVNVSLARVPLHVRQAFVATEDRRFYSHDGVDWHAAFRAAAHNAAAMAVREGFSTITMQVARNTFTSRSGGDRSLRRKLLELRLARLIERNLRKDEILELYLNVIYLGDGAYGVEAASRDLFGKSVSALTLPEGAVLAALPKGPSAYTPRRSPERSRERRDLVLGLMRREGFVTPDAARAAAALPLVVSGEPWHPLRANAWAVGAVKDMVDSLLGARGLDEGDVTVYTTLDAPAQRAAERSIAAHAAQIDRESHEIDAGQDGDEVQGALVAIDPRSGDIRALVGGRREEPRGFDRALFARRQPGSAFKPFVYAAAMAAGYTPATLVADDPVEIEDGGRIWTPQNFGGAYGGIMTLRRALMRSANAATVRVSRAVGEQPIVDLATRQGIESPLRALPSIALGAFEVTPLELVTAYAPFANGGMRVHPRLVTGIVAADGTVLWHAETVVPTRVLDARDAFQITSMLQSVVDAGTGRAVRDRGARGAIAGKTGTTNDGDDVWFVGYTPTLAAVVWFGYDHPHPLGGEAAGGRLAAPAWADFYVSGWREPRGVDWQPPSGLVERVIDAENGELAGEWCPVTQREWFKAGTEPHEYCREHLAPAENAFSDLGRRIAAGLRRLLRF